MQAYVVKYQQVTTKDGSEAILSCQDEKTVLVIIRGPKPGVLKAIIFKMINEIEVKRASGESSENFLCTKHGIIHEQDVIDNMDELIEQLFAEINQAAEVLGSEAIDIVLDALVKANLITKFRLNSYQQGSKIKDTLHFIYRSNRAGIFACMTQE